MVRLASIISITLCLVFAKSSAQQQSAMLVDKQSRDHLQNLKDSVKSVRFRYSDVDSGLSENEKSRVYYHNDINNTPYIEFNREGNVTATIDKKTLYSNDDVLSKKSLVQKTRQVYPVYDGNVVRPDRKVVIIKDSIVFMYNYRYNVKEGEILEERKYFSYLSLDDPSTEPDESSLQQRMVNSYNTNGNLVKQHFYEANAENPIELFIMDTSAGICDDTSLNYEYDSKNRITKVTFISCEEIIESEEYTYHPRGYITTIKRHISDNAFSKYPASNMVAQYNEHGDLIEIHFLTRSGAEPPSGRIGDEPVYRYYEYDYDSHNNWIKCRMYLMGTKDRPSLTVERQIEYY